MSDINSEWPVIEIYINKVGIKGVYIPLYSKIREKEVQGIFRVDVYVDLSERLRGIHASRSYESIIESIINYEGRTIRLEDLCENVSRDLLTKHEYAERSSVLIKGMVTLPSTTPIRRRISLKKIVVFGKAFSAKKDDDIINTKKFIGVKLSGLTACPSAQRTISKLWRKKYGLSINKGPYPTHMQRGYAKIMIEVPHGYIVDLEELIDIATTSFSSPTYELLKRDDEAELILNALEKTRLTEDVVREMAKKVAVRFNALPDSTRVFIEYESLESIHDHNLVARLHSTLGALKKKCTS